MPVDTSSLSQSRDRRADLLKVADLFWQFFGWDDYTDTLGLDGKRPFGYSTGGGVYEILDAIGAEPIDDGFDEDGGKQFSREQHEYARALFAELPAFLKAEWEKYRLFRRSSGLDDD